MKYLAPIKPECIPAAAVPLERCVYCWYAVYPTLPFPSSWSSTCCSGHRAWILAQSARNRARRVSRRVASEPPGVPLMVRPQMMEERP
jgi:hypothetical protein